jgi:hypothetical protein
VQEYEAMRASTAETRAKLKIDRTK